ncbi:hypothetical protein LJB93_01650 [Desulfovibrio sp. OttesenSCG-928-F07]|nr:hypothetical protein [Desulfovibrio sp. OttesenSCG-928-F07]
MPKNRKQANKNNFVNPGEAEERSDIERALDTASGADADKNIQNVPASATMPDSATTVSGSSTIINSQNGAVADGQNVTAPDNQDAAATGQHISSSSTVVLGAAPQVSATAQNNGANKSGSGRAPVLQIGAPAASAAAQAGNGASTRQGGAQAQHPPRYLCSTSC